MHPLVLAGLLGGWALLEISFSRRIQSPFADGSLHTLPVAPVPRRNILTLLLYGALGIFFFLFPMALIQGGDTRDEPPVPALLPMILLMF